MAPRAALEQIFGYDVFRTGQEAVVEAVLAGRDSLDSVRRR